MLISSKAEPCGVHSLPAMIYLKLFTFREAKIVISEPTSTGVRLDYECRNIDSIVVIVSMYMMDWVVFKFQSF